MNKSNERDRKRVALFATCLIDVMRPSVGFAAARLIEGAGFSVEVPQPQVCCGQPAYNSGDLDSARDVGRQTIALLEPYPWVVVPSGSCAGMLKVHLPELFDADPSWHARAQQLADKTYEVTRFLTDIGELDLSDSRFEGKVTYHDSCSSYRELGVFREPRSLLAQLDGLSLVESGTQAQCCGFGGTFCVKFPNVSNALVTEKLESFSATGADLVAGGDLGCLLNIAGASHRQGRKLRVYHVCEVLAGMTDEPGIGDP